MAKLDKIQFDSTSYEIVPEIAPLFNTSTAYAAGDCVIKDAVLYRFKTAHAAGAWIGTDAEAIEVGKELTGLKQEFSQNTNQIKSVSGVNLLNYSKMADNGYYYAGFYENANYCYFIVPVESGKTYRYDYLRFGSTKTTAVFNTSGFGLNAANVYTADFTGDIYLSVDKNYFANAFFCEEKDYSLVNPPKFETPVFQSDVLAQAYGFSENVPISQNGLAKIFPVVDGTDLCFTGKYVEGKYAASANDKVIVVERQSFCFYVIPASEGHYKFSAEARFVVASDSEGNTLLYLGGNGGTSTDIDCPEGTEYLWVTFYATDIATAKIGRGHLIPTTTKLSAVALKTTGEQLTTRLYGKGYYRQTGILGDTSWHTPAMCLKKNQVYSFLTKVTTLGEIHIGHGTNAYDSAYLVIDDTNVTLHRYFSYDQTTVYAHGLTISDYLYIQVVVGVGKATIKLFSNGSSFTQENVPWSGSAYSYSYVKQFDSVLSDCTFTWSSADFRKATWMFGNSYFGMDNAERWVSYLINAGYGDNVLLNGYPGSSSQNAWYSLVNMLGTFGVPKTIIWCLGMNDGSDTNASTPSATWLSAINSIKGACESYGIELILATIPTVPNINHEGKNAYVRASGYRYIDFASAVGADGTGAWYTGMLSSDNVHPTEKGAKALFYQAIADAPEITYSNP